MASRSQRRERTRPVPDVDPATLPVVGPRDPCPCGSGRRSKACHGREAARADEVFVARPFAGLASECDWVALREIVPAATAPLTLLDSDAAVVLATVLPLAWPAVHRMDGTVQVGLQVPGGSGDVSRDVAADLLRALEAEPGTPLAPAALPGPGPRLQDVLDVTVPLDVTVHRDFDFWMAGLDAPTGEAAASLAQANAGAVPTVRLAGVEAAYWCELRDRNHLRWVLPHDEEPLLDAWARLHARGLDRLGEGTRFVGSFRAHGLLAPVWDLAPGTTAEAVEEPAAVLADRLGDALAQTGPLSGDERRARAGLLNRQLTLR